MRIRYAGKLWDVWLQDDGTLDTVISVQPVGRPKAHSYSLDGGMTYYDYPTDYRGPYYPALEERFDIEYASEFRRPNGEMTMRGLRVLGQEAADAYEFCDEEG